MSIEYTPCYSSKEDYKIYREGAKSAKEIKSRHQIRLKINS